jgi:spermidine synthase
MVARMALPRLGGAPAVWNSAMLVYQVLLLGGYAYAHVAGRLKPAWQGALHLLLVGLAALWLPLGLGAATPPADASPILWVPWLLVASIGPLFFVVSAQAPLMQRWFALREPGANPYALYVASNLGSFGGLLAYPLLLEPLLPVGTQTFAWSMGYILLCALVAGCVILLPRRAPAEAIAAPADDPAPSLTTRLQWIALAAVPSGLILAATTHITTDILAMPLIWVAPLGLYLLSFTFAFADNGRVAPFVSRYFPIVLIVAGAAAGSGVVGNLWLMMIGDLAIVFLGAVTLHYRLYGLRPGPSRLTDFYLCMAVGGVVGGIFCALVAPAVFDWLYEYPILILAAALLMPLRADAQPLNPWQRRWVPLAAVLLSMYAGGLFGGTPPVPLMVAALVAIAFLARLAIGDRIVFTACIAALILGLGCWSNLVRTVEHHSRTRSYFGIYTVGENGSGIGRARILVHGTTTHGIQLRDPALATWPTSYYAQGSGIGIAMRAAPSMFGTKARIGVVGLGAGTLACYARPGQDWRFYEIDPAIAAIARNPRDFTFLSRCLPGVPIEIGDARLTLATAPASSRDLLAIDAFSSDAIPMHLLTREAIENYGRVLTTDGLLMFHISNKYVDLEPVLAAAAAADGWQIVVRDYRPDEAAAERRATPSVWVAMSRSAATLERLRSSDPAASWRPVRDRAGFNAWSDDYGSILPLLKGF